MVVVFDDSSLLVQVIFSTVFNSSVLPPTTIPLDRSDCANFVPTNTPCQEAPTSFNDVCDAVLSSFTSTGDTCTTNYPDCTTTVCDLSSFSLPVMYGYTIMPCTPVPSVRVHATSNGSEILDEVLSETRVETLNVGPTNVSVRFIVNQSPPDYRDIGVGVSLIERLQRRVWWTCSRYGLCRQTHQTWSLLAAYSFVRYFIR